MIIGLFSRFFGRSDPEDGAEDFVPGPAASPQGTEFVALDFETANADLSSICQVGAVLFRSDQVVHTLSTMVNPEDYFDAGNSSIHGITASMVKDAPLFQQVFAGLVELARERIVVAHTWFDRVALDRAREKYSLPETSFCWLDTARVARRAWPEEFGRSGYGLANVAECCGVQFQHHRADEDARAAGEVLIHAMRHTGLTLTDWLGRVEQPIDPHGSRTRIGNPEGPLAGEEVVFTGTLSIPRREAAELAAAAGCDVAKG